MAQTTRTVTTGATVTTRTTQHNLSLQGLAGAMLILILVCFVAFIISFTTPGWTTVNTYGYRYGLWEQCTSLSTDVSHHVATQALMCLALVGLVIAIILIFLYLFVHTVSKYRVLLGLVIDSFLTFALMLIAIIVYGAESGGDLSWSYAIAVIATILCLCAAIVSAIQLSRC